MKEGVYLLILPGDDFGVPTVVRNIDGGAVLVTIEGVRLLANLPKGYVLIRMVTVTPKRLAALEVAITAVNVLDEIYHGSERKHDDIASVLQAIIEEVEEVTHEI